MKINFVSLIRKMCDKAANKRPYTEENQDRYLAERVKALMKKAFDAGQEYTQVSRFAEDGFTFDHENFKEWFDKKYK